MGSQIFQPGAYSLNSHASYFPIPDPRTGKAPPAQLGTLVLITTAHFFPSQKGVMWNLCLLAPGGTGEVGSTHPIPSGQRMAQPKPAGPAGRGTEGLGWARAPEP